jgi:(p)ppGpp synthase/HD superfamily hydrolase
MRQDVSTSLSLEERGRLMPTLEDAILLAAQGHRGQVDKVGQPYVLHLLRVMMRVESEKAQIVAVLHDLVEDTSATFDDLRALGYSEEIIQALDCVTKRPDETYEQFIDRAGGNPLARRVKRADLEDNMDIRRLPVISDKDQERLNRYIAAWRRLQALD